MTAFNSGVRATREEVINSTKWFIEFIEDLIRKYNVEPNELESYNKKDLIKIYSYELSELHWVSQEEFCIEVEESTISYEVRCIFKNVNHELIGLIYRIWGQTLNYIREIKKEIDAKERDLELFKWIDVTKPFYC